MTDPGDVLRKQMGWVDARAVITLKVADEGDKTIWVTDDVETVTRLINDCTDRLVTLTRVKGMRPYPFSTRPDNIANIGDLS
jgi:hypothetical protein